MHRAPRRRWGSGCVPVALALLLAAPAVSFPLDIAHRGGTVDAPENTLANFELAISYGVDWIETDVWVSADGVPVLHHDTWLGRTSNGSGLVFEKTLAELKALDAGSWFSPEYAGEPIPTLAEALDLVRGRAKLFIEIKRREYIPAVAAVIEASGIPHEDVITWIRLGTGMAADYKAALPDSPIVLSASARYGFRERDMWERAEAGDLGLIGDYKLIDQRWVDLLHSYGLRAYARVVVSTSFFSVMDLGVDGLVVSHPRWLELFLPRSTPECQDGIDNDGDGLVDHPADPGCFGPEDTHEDAPCSDGIDNDGDGFADFPDDPGCYAPFYPTESPACDDGQDNDADGAIDFPAAPGCFARFDQTEAAECSDGVDNDLDGLVDWPDDPGCRTAHSLREDPQCSDGIDNDKDGPWDANDPACVAPWLDSEVPACANGVDDDGDGAVDTADTGCTDAADVSEVPDCSDGIDNERDGTADFFVPGSPTSTLLPDPACESPLDPSEVGQCEDGIDNDGNGVADYGFDPGCMARWDPVEAPRPACGLLGPEALFFPWLALALRRRMGRCAARP